MKTSILLLLIFSISAFGNDVIELGSLEIDGESRRPMIDYSSSNTNIMKVMKIQLENEKKRYASALSSDNRDLELAPDFQFSNVDNMLPEHKFEFSQLNQEL